MIAEEIVKKIGTDQIINDGNRIHKSRFKKSITGISESFLEIPRVWDCGKIKFEKNIII